MHGLNRRGVLAGLGLIVPAAGLAQTPTRSAVHFEVWRNNQKIGEHSVSFRGDDAVLTAAIVAEMLVKLGPIPLFRYRHEATEVWRGGRFATLDSYSISNGKVERVSAVRTDEAVTITTGPGRSVRGSARACPLTHWNPTALEGPLFNPQTGALVRETVSRGAESLQLPDGRTVNATCYKLRGDAEIADLYDPAGAWIALRGKVSDGSSIEYRRV